MKVTVKMGPVKLNFKGFRELRKSPGAQALVMDRARRWAAACGPGFKAEMAPSRNRARAVVYPDTPEAQARDRADLVMLRNINAAR